MDRWLRCHGRTTLCIAAVLAVALTGCEQEQTEDPSASSHSTGTDTDASGDALSTAAMAAATDPAISEWLEPVNNASFTYNAPGNTILATVLVDNVAAEDDLSVQFYFNGASDGEPVPIEGDTVTYEYPDVGIGMHHLTAWIVDADGTALSNVESRESVYIKVVTTCGDETECDDGNVCTNEVCITNSCRYGSVSGCCAHDLECPFGQFCDENTCVECLTDEHCDDGNPCTSDACGLDGTCSNDPTPDCCWDDPTTSGEEQCDDGIYCTVDSCDLETNTCVHDDLLDDPGSNCCNTDADCKPEDDPCASYLCYRNSAEDVQSCRYGPRGVGCCVDDSDCYDGNPCTDDRCVYADSADESGQCVYEEDPEDTTCCVTDADCDDGDLSTVDVCVDNVCQHQTDENYCDLPDTSPIVINEIMAAPGSVDDALGEWIEIYNASPNMIDLDGFIVETDDGESHTLTAPLAVNGSTGLHLFPGQYFVMARSVDSSLNGGFFPHYQLQGITLPDNFEPDGADVTRTITLKDPEGTVIDSVTYDTAVWGGKDGRSWALTHMFADNSDPASWGVAGDESNDPAKQIKYGDTSNDLYGTPKNFNEDVYEGLDHPGCVAPEDAHSCAVGKCGVDSQCFFPLEEGCCETDADCDDFKACTIDTCDTANGICEPSVWDEDCCETNSDCDDGNPCNLDRCIGNTCRYSSNVIDGCCVNDEDCSDGDSCTIDECDTAENLCEPSEPIVLDGQQCCNSDGDCDDGDPATTDTCDFSQSPPVCIFPPDPDYCTDVSDPCDDGNVCTDDFCDVGANQCLHTVVEGCCKKNADCPSDDNPCTAEVCEESTGECSSVEIEGCCIADDACDDGDPCTEDFCGSGNVCHNTEIEGCCETAQDCDDGVECTTDSCVDSQCQYTQQDDCCTSDMTASELTAACGEDPDGTANCFQWECTTTGQCNLLENEECCQTAEDCDDGDPCTDDYCTTSNTCKHVATTSGSCCIYNADCPALDNNVCTEPFCDAGTCTEAPVPGCSPPIGEDPTEPLPEDPGTDPDSCWVSDTSGYLGPDEHQECIGEDAVVGEGAILTMSSFDPDNADSASIQFNLAWLNGAGAHNVHVMATATEGDWSVAETLDVIPASGDNPGTQYNYSLSNFLLAQNQVWIGFKVESDTPDNVDVSVDDLTVATGHAPYYVQHLQSDKTYDRSEDELVDGGTVTAQLGEVRTRTYWAHDQQWNSQTLNFELLDAPDFVTIDDTAKLSLFGVWQVTMGIRANSSDDIGSYGARIRVSDGAFTSTIPVEIVVGLGRGYVVWAPDEVAAADGDGITDALDAAGKNYQRVASLSDIDDWSPVRGLFITMGGGASTSTMSSEQVQPAVDFIESGGDVYLEGSATFAEDLQTTLQGKFNVSVVQTDGGVNGAMSGRAFLYPMTWDYTADAAYYEDVDHLAPKQGTDARKVLEDDQSGAAVAVAYEDPATGGRVVGSTVLTSRLEELGATPEQYIAGVIDFFDNGYGGCSDHVQCDDGDACTIDECIGGQCQNNEDTTCDACQGDLDCADGEVCLADGTCQPQDGGEVGDPIDDTTFNCDTTDELVQIVKSTSGFETITNANVRLHLELDESQKVGTLNVTLSHNGRLVTLVEPDPTNNGTVIDTTFDAGTLPAQGTMSDFDGQFVEGDWVLTVEDTTGGEACGTVHAFDIWLETAPAPTCSVDEDCDNGQFCDGTETCADGTCQAGTAPTCDDSDSCTLDQCDPGASSGAGACDNTGRTQTCAGESCSGAHAIDAGDGQCGLSDACVGGLDQGDGTCTEVCETCAYASTGDVRTAIEDFQCVTEVMEVTADDPYASEVFVQVDVDHPNLSDLTVNLYSPDNAKVPLVDGSGSGLADFHSTFPLSNSNPAGDLCSLAGVEPSGLWKVQVCDNVSGNKGMLSSAAVWVGTRTTDPTVGNTCDSAISVPVDGTTHNLAHSTECFANSTAGSCTGGDGHDIVYTLTLPTTMRVTATVQASEFDAGIYLTDSCNVGSTFCSDTEPAGGTEVIDELVEPGTWYLVVDSLSGSGGDFTLDVGTTTPKANGQTCDENLDCESGHCQNGFCCEDGDCCALASDCPGDYSAAPSCDDATTCQGHREDATCTDYQCGTENVADDTACDSGVESDDCDLFDSVFCNGEADQTQPSCLETCGGDSDCDAGAHCFEGTCRLDLDDSLTCGRDGHCDSGYCVDGVCCNNACDGQCERCDLSGSKGTCSFSDSGSDPDDDCDGTGVCGGTCDGDGGCTFPPETLACDTCMRCDGAGFCENPVDADTDPDGSCGLCQVCDGTGACADVPSGDDPLGECADEGASTCGQNGSCDGTGACELYASGTVCVDQSCTDGYRDPAHTCDGEGTCVDPDDEFCDGLKCEGTGTDCLAVCTEDSDCLTGYFCDTGTGECLPKSARGETCAADNECLSNFCTDDVCCESACAGPCRQCNLGGQEGTCVDHDALTDPEGGCDLYWCDGTGNCKFSCDTDTDCKPGNWCDGSTCKPKEDLGGSCTADNQCTSGICNLQDGVCCDTACTSTCESCKLDGFEGQCTVIPEGDDPDDECWGQGATCGGSCDGAGSCQFPSSSKSCGTCQRCDGAGECLAVPANSDPDNDCGTCQTCDGSGSCKNVPEGADFHDDCPTTDQSTCGTNGQCDGNATCDYYGAGTLAAPASCTDGVATLADTCDGAGGVNDGGTQDCAPYICDGVSCGTTCGSHTDCADGFFCDFDDLDGDGRTDDCEALRPDGGQCGADHECAAGYCSNGFCCSGGTCCSQNSDCQDPSLGFAEPPVCDDASSGGCVGHRVDALCDGNSQCYAETVDDPSACASNVCQQAGCDGLTYTTERTCDNSGGCTVGGEILSCDDGNVCTNDFCDPAGACEHTDNDDASTPCYEGPDGTEGVGICEGGDRVCQDGNTGACEGQVLPRTETCADSRDEDCDGEANEPGAEGCTVYFKDVDDDSYGTDDYECLCSPGPSGFDHYTATRNGDCDDSNGDVNPGAQELCATEGVDDNCNNLVDEDGAADCSTEGQDYYFDGDGDTYGAEGSSPVCKCAAEAPYDATRAGDCDDQNNTINPGQTEQCNGYDDNCDGVVDTDERSASAMCGDDIPNATAGCKVGVCYVESCDTDYHDIDGEFTNGCEVREDWYDRNDVGDTCADPYSNSALNYVDDSSDELVDRSGNVVPGGDSDWFRVRFRDLTSYAKDFNPEIFFTDNPDGLKFEVFRGSCSGPGHCDAKGGLTKLELDGETSYHCAGPDSTNTYRSGSCGHPSYSHCCNRNRFHMVFFYVRVFHPDDEVGPNNNTYTLRFQNRE
ncbi:MAG: lamin tail domain-containing protein [Myxococcota bacterium]